MLRGRFQFVILSSVLAVSMASCRHDVQRLKARYVANADRFVAQQKYAEAIIEYRNAITQDSNFGEARYKLGMAYEAVGERPNALGEFVRAADLMPNNVDAQLKAGQLLLDFKQFPEAKARALNALAQAPKNIDALTLMGNSLAGLKDYKSAIEQIEQALDEDPHRVLTYTNLGLVQVLQGSKSAAEETFKRAVEVNPTSPAAHMSLANYYWASRDGVRAEAELKRALAIDPRSPGVNRLLGAFYVSAGRMADAEPFLKTFAEVTNDIGAKLVLGDYYVRTEKLKEATDVLEGVSKDANGFAPAQVRLAAMAFRAGQSADGYKKVDAVLARQPENQDAVLMKARFLLHDRKFVDALKLTKSITERDPGSAEAHFLSGSVLEATQSTDEAIKEFQEVLRLRPSTTAASVELAKLFLIAGDIARATEFSGQAVKSSPQSTTAHFMSAKSQVRLGNLTNAEPQVMALAKIDGRSSDVQILVGDFYWAKRDLPRASEAYTRALEIKGGSVEALAGLVRIDLFQKNPTAARSRIAPRLAAAPDDPNLLLLAGETFMAIGDPAQAEKAFRHLLDVDPSNLAAYHMLSGIYLSAKRLDEARAEYEEVARRQPKAAPAAWTMMGIISSLQNKPDEARKQWEQALVLDPRAAVAANNLAWTYAESGASLDQALQLAQTAKATLPKNGEVSDTLGWIYYKKGLAGLAVTALTEGVEQAPKDSTVHYHLGLAYLKNGNQKEARQAMEQALKLDPKFAAADDAKRVIAKILSGKS